MYELESRDGEWLPLDDELTVMRWRTERLLALGYELRLAASLAISGVDIHELERLIGNGCPRETAVRIAA
ncbi:MAG: hypothetical protein ACRDNP_10215 [Gaiellaceae bacterium]